MTIPIGEAFIIIFERGALRVHGSGSTNVCADYSENESGNTPKVRRQSWTRNRSRPAPQAREQTGFDNGKKLTGLKRHILVDTLGLLITVVVHAASVSETPGGQLVLMELMERWWRLKLIRLDGGYMSGLFAWVKTLKRWRTIRVEQVKRSDDQKGFQVLPKRWIVERTFGWLTKHRRLSKDYEGLTETSETMVYVAMIRLMLARLDS